MTSIEAEMVVVLMMLLDDEAPMVLDKSDAVNGYY